MHPTRVVGISLNTYDLDDVEARRACEQAVRETGLPSTDPVRFDPAPLVDAIAEKRAGLGRSGARSDMAQAWEGALERWLEAGLLDAETTARVRAWETGQGRGGVRWPARLALGLGGLLLCAGVLLFVAAHWEALSPARRFGLVLVTVAGFHLAGAFAAERAPALAVTLHACGTVALGGGIFLAGQVFNLRAHWPGGLMLWAVGAWIGWGLRRGWAQAVLAAVLTPAWLAGEWIVATERMQGQAVFSVGLLLLALTYLGAEPAPTPAFERGTPRADLGRGPGGDSGRRIPGVEHAGAELRITADRRRARGGGLDRGDRGPAGGGLRAAARSAGGRAGARAVGGGRSGDGGSPRRGALSLGRRSSASDWWVGAWTNGAASGSTWVAGLALAVLVFVF